MLKEAEKIYLSLKELRVRYFLVFLFFGLCSCQSPPEISQINNTVTLDSPKKCPNTPMGSLTNPEAINIDGQTFQKTGRISSDNDKGFVFQGKQGQKLSYSYNDRLCVWIYTPDNKLLSGVELPIEGTYAVHLASLKGTTTFEIKMKLSDPNTETMKVVDKRPPDVPLDRDSSEKITSSSCSNAEMSTKTLNSSSFAKAKGLDLVKSFHTNSFQIFIYNKKGKLYYCGIKKTDNRDSIFLPANYQQGKGYVAVNKKYKYIINNSHLSIYRGETLLQKQPVVQ